MIFTQDNTDGSGMHGICKKLPTDYLTSLKLKVFFQ